jgi:opacity protein-like surface antigen
LAARLGVASGRWPFYGKAGGGGVGVKTTGAVASFGNSRSDSGFLIGAGIEYVFANNWTAKLEYDFLGLSNRSFVVPAGASFLAGDVFSTSNRNVRELKVGLNFLFGRGSGF